MDNYDESGLELSRPSRLLTKSVPHPDNTISLATGSFANARGFVMNDCNFYDLSGMSGLEKLWTFVSPDAYHDALTSNPRTRCHPETRKDILATVMTWFNDSRTSQRIMWLCGPAGSGKSSIAQTVAEDYSGSGKLGASFFFLRDSTNRGGVEHLVPTLAWKMAHTIPGIAAHLDRALREDPSIPTKSVDIQFEHLVMKPCKDLANSSTSSRFLVIIDGVDECADEHRQKYVLELIKDAAARNPLLRFLICSRPEDHIRRMLWQNVARHVTLEDTSEVREDITRYLKDEFSRIFDKGNLETSAEPWPTDEVIEELVSKSSAQFIYASTVLKFVDDDDCKPKDQLEVILGLRTPELASPFGLLDQLYTQILSQQRDHITLMKLLALIIVFDRPSLRFISAQLNVEMDDLLLKLRRMHSVLHVSWFVEAHHLSLLDFLQDKRRAGKYYLSRSRIGFEAAKPITKEFITYALGFVSTKALDWCTIALNVGVKALYARGFLLFFIVLFKVFSVSAVMTLITSGFNTSLSRSFRSGAHSDSSRRKRREKAMSRIRHGTSRPSDPMLDDPEQMNSSRLGWDVLQLFSSHNWQQQPGCHPGTRETALRLILDWASDLGKVYPIMWLYGPPGAGKSCIAQTVAERCEREGRLAASFFFSRGSLASSNIHQLFPTLALQIAHSVPKAAPFIELALEDDPSIPAMPIDEQFDRLIVETFEILADLSVQPHNDVVIIDGLDECDNEELQNGLLQLIEGALNHRNLPLRFLICSRPEIRIAQQFDSMSSITHRVGLDDKSEAQKDVRRYLKDEFTRISAECMTTPLVSLSWPSDDEIDSLVLKSSSQFLYASTAIKFIDDKDRDHHEQLEAVLRLDTAGSSSPFAELDQLYTLILSQQHDYKLLMKFLVIFIVWRRLEVDYICRRISIKEEELQLTLFGMRPLLHVSSNYIVPRHDSFCQYLQDRSRAGRFYVGRMEVTWVRFLAKFHRLWAAIYDAYKAIQVKSGYPRLVTFCVLSAPIVGLVSVIIFVWVWSKILCEVRSSFFPNLFTFVEGICSRI